jgi:hypothetical protein
MDIVRQALNVYMQVSSSERSTSTSSWPGKTSRPDLLRPVLQ